MQLKHTVAQYSKQVFTKGTCFIKKNPEPSQLRSQKAATNTTVPTAFRSFHYLQLSSQCFQIHYNLHMHNNSESNYDHSYIAKLI